MTQKGLITLKLSLISLSILLTTLTVYSAPVYRAASLAQVNTASPGATPLRLSGRPGWNPLWGIGPVIPPPGSLDNVPVNNEDPPATDTTDTTDTDTSLDTASNSDVANANVADAASDTSNENGADSITTN